MAYHERSLAIEVLTLCQHSCVIFTDFLALRATQVQPTIHRLMVKPNGSIRKWSITYEFSPIIVKMTGLNGSLLPNSPITTRSSPHPVIPRSSSTMVTIHGKVLDIVE